MQTRATLALCPCICAIYNFEKYCVVLFFVLKVIYKGWVFFSLLCTPLLPSPKILFTMSQSTFIHVFGWQRGGGGRESHPPYQSPSKWLVWT